MNVIEKLKESKLVPVLRAPSQEEGLRMAHALVSGGVKVLEVTMTVPGAIDLIAQLSQSLSEDILIGAGTVLDPETAEKCRDAGAKFIVSPALNIATVEWCKAEGIACAPGCLTPTEILTAHQAGADLIKIFPADAVGGASYIKALKGPFPHIEFMPTGGVNLATIKGFFEAGAVAVGVGSNLVNPKLNSEEIAILTREFVKAA
ncbi:MAG: bifunctional 4-hydroxy-2-oxoglutarate aldolase/2-dehydro-3-deoxy-phosphogluconate aldolase [Fimbriimonas sp.]|nr:bifunctional 4-hydroxy-2-oxoglutarate aldolase/2-dehydro-3-deoxy-phosphogluconate aldolase [Fimbriimonas sp.]